jgi:class 3 adenylate cyclase
MLAVAIDGFSRLLARDEAWAIDLLEEYEGLVEEQSSRHAGELIRRSGDESLLCFDDAISAFQAAFELSEAWNDGARPRLRMGLAAESVEGAPGDADAEDPDAEDPGAGHSGVAGPTARSAMRLQSIATAGTLGVTGPVLGEIRGKLEYVSVALGELHLSGRGESLPAFAVTLPGGAGDTRSGGSDHADAVARGQRELPKSMYPTRRASGNEREDREAEAAWDQALETPTNAESGESDPLVEEYVDQTEEAASQAVAGFRGHAATYAAVNAGLFGIWGWTGTGFPWFLIPLFAWGIGLSSHYDAMRRQRLEARELSELPIETREQLRTYRQFTKARAGWRGHLVSTGATSVLLFTINMITSPAFPWFLFPVGGMGIGLVSHYPRYRAKSRRLLARIRDLAVPGRVANADRTLGRQGRLSQAGTIATRRRRRKEGAEAGPSANGGTSVAEAETLRDAIIEGVAASPELSRESFTGVLDECLARIRSLSATYDELAATGTRDDLEKTESELRELRGKLDGASDERLHREYERSIDQLERQRRSYEELLRDQELIEVRLRAAVNMLKQMRVEVARTRGATGGIESLDELKHRSEELSGYLADLRQAYDELDS